VRVAHRATAATCATLKLAATSNNRQPEIENSQFKIENRERRQFLAEERALIAALFSDPSSR
jgi:hypothetical protein